MQSAEFDYSAPAELFLAKPARLCRTKYRQFATAAEALRFAVEELRIPKAFGAWLEVGDQRFNSMEIRRLYRPDRCTTPSDCCPRVLFRNIQARHIAEVRLSICTVSELSASVSNGQWRRN
jgi:hypothetical protein